MGKLLLLLGLNSTSYNGEIKNQKDLSNIEVYFSLMQNNSVEINQGNDLTGQPGHQQPRLLLCSLTIPDE